MASIREKILVLEKIEEAKHILFGKFNPTLTRQTKQDKWKEVFGKCQMLGLFLDKEFTYLRDVFFPNLKKTTMAKIDRSRSTGTGGGKDAKLTEIDNKILDIIGRETPGVVGLPVEETPSVFSVSRTPPPRTPRRSERTPTIPTCSTSTPPSSRPKTQTPRGRGLQKKRCNKKTIGELQVEKLTLHNEYLRQLTYQLQLDNFEREARLGLTSSPLTKLIWDRNNNTTTTIPDPNNESTLSQEVNIEDYILEEELNEQSM
ncbi:hypothetical protein M8J76_011996 [Diaphorina citri]|nr:hypothetical protein M8J76_011996 [Diaphorina citri]